MATRLKTVHYSFPTIASVTNNTLTNFTQITIFIPETVLAWRSARVIISADDIITGTGGTITTKTVGLRLGAAAYTTISNANALTNSGENLSFYWIQNFRSHFATNWTGTSMTCDVQVQFNQSTGTTLGLVNVACTLELTYEYNDTASTKIKTVHIPLNAPVSNVSTTSTTVDTIPALDTYLPEASKTYRNIFLVVIGNEHRNAATTDHTMTFNVGTATVTTGNYEGALASDRFFRYVWNLTSTYPSTAAAQNFQIRATVARCNHLQAYLVVTYEYNEASTSTVMNSVLLPMDLASPMGGITSSDYQRGTRDLWIQEPATITTQRIAFYAYWTQIAEVGGLNMRIGTGAFIAYTDTASVLCGSNAAMVRNDSAFTLQRGRNTLNFDVYRTDTVDLGWSISGFWIVNYTSGKSSQGTCAHNHTVFLDLISFDTGNIASYATTTATSFPIPETTYFLNAVGLDFFILPSGTTGTCGLTIATERLSAEGGIKWEPVYYDMSVSDPEVGVFPGYVQMRSYFKRWPSDADTERLDIQTSRRWRWHSALVGATTAIGWVGIGWMVTYHSINYTVSGTISGFTGTVNLDLWRSGTNEKLLSSTRSGDGSYSFTWYDNTQQVFVSAEDGSGNKGRTSSGVATGSP